tara:strand:- start:305 stop:2233 length:1929 start_codon:yes stop_codon:yes gene_type:complete
MATNTAASFTSHTGNNTAGPFSISFGYLSEDEIDVTVDGVLKTKTTHYTFPSATTISFTSGNYPGNSAAIKFQRDTNISAKRVDFEDGSVLTETDLDTNTEHLLYGIQEVLYKVESRVFDTIQIADSAITSVKIADGAIVNADVNASAAIAGTKISPDFGSQVITTTGNIVVGGTVDGRDVAADGSKLDGIDTGAKDDQTAAEIKTLLAASKLTSAHIEPDAITSTEIEDGSVTAAKLNAATVITSSEQATATVNDTSFLTSQAADARYFNISSGDTIKDGVSFPDNDTTIATTAAINDRIIDLVEDVGGFVPIANETSFPAANPDVNNGTGTLVSIKEFASSHTPSGGTVTIANGAGSGNTVTITGCGSTVLAAGFGAILETTSTLHTYTFHRLSPKSTEVTTVAGISTNITTVAGIDANVTTVATNNANVTTVATNISNVNSVAGSIANVNTVATNLSGVNDFAARYRVASNDPTSSLDVGDLVFNSTANELRVYNGSSWQSGVTATGNLVSKSGDTLTGDLILDNAKSLKLSETDANGSHTISIKAPDSVTADTTLTLPDGAGSSGYLLSTNGTGTLSWVVPPNSTGGGGTDNVFQENDQTITSSYTLTANTNASSVGPLALNSEVTIEVPANATLVIL